jgi:hypothetical protein
MTHRQGEEPSQAAMSSTVTTPGAGPLTLDEGDVVLGKYIIKSQLGAGGMGQVFRALHIRLARDVAVKILPDNRSEENALRFEREAALMTRVRHPNVVEMLDFGFLEGRVPCIVMELVEGESLATRLLRSRAQPWQDAVRIVLGVLEGLEAVHDAQVLHRDLKPSNIALSKGPPELVKLLDFGIARSLAGESDRRLTRTGNIVGSLDYMSPEALVNDPIDVRTDVYAAGMILYEMLSGSYPFQDDAMAAAFRRLSNDPPSPKAPAGFAEVPAALAKLAQRSIARERNDRPESAESFAEQLREFVARPRRSPSPSGSQPALEVAATASAIAMVGDEEVTIEARKPRAIPAEIVAATQAPTQPADAAPTKRPERPERPAKAAAPPAAPPPAAPRPTPAKPKRVLANADVSAPKPPPIPKPPEPVVLPKAPREPAPTPNPKQSALAPRPQFVLLARLPKQRFAAVEERRWLADLVRDVGTAYAIGAFVWCAVLHGVDSAATEKRSLVLLDALKARYPGVAVVGSPIFDPHFALKSAMIAADEKLPDPLPALVAQLASIGQ